jgi:hypothetical protein
MKNFKQYLLFLISFIILLKSYMFTQSQVIRDQFKAGSSAKVFKDTVYLCSSHYALAIGRGGLSGCFCMEDYLKGVHGIGLCIMIDKE